jgi:hypothetical protein
MEPSISKSYSRTDLRRAPARQTVEEFEPPQQRPLLRVIVIFVALLMALLFLNRVFKLRTHGGPRDPISTSSRVDPQPTDSGTGGENGKKTAEPEVNPDEKDYGAPPIDIVPGNSRVIGK